MSAPARATHSPSLATQAVGRNLKCRDRWQWNQSRKDTQGLDGHLQVTRDTFLEVSDLPKSALPSLTHGLVLLPHLCMRRISHRGCSPLILSLGRLQPSNSEGGCSKGRSDQVTCTATAPCSLCQPNPAATDRTGGITVGTPTDALALKKGHFYRPLLQGHLGRTPKKATRGCVRLP